MATWLPFVTKSSRRLFWKLGIPVSIGESIHTTYIGVSDSSILGTNEMFGDFVQ